MVLGSDLGAKGAGATFFPLGAISNVGFVEDRGTFQFFFRAKAGERCAHRSGARVRLWPGPQGFLVARLGGGLTCVCDCSCTRPAKVYVKIPLSINMKNARAG